ncbi:MAG: hypothetical protein ACK512_00845 [Cyanobium sp.]
MLGKTAGKDLTADKTTYPTLLGLRNPAAAPMPWWRRPSSLG